MAEHSERYIRIQRWSIGIGVTLLIAGLGAIGPVNTAYEGWHDAKVRLTIREMITPIQIAQNDNANKLDFLVKAEAARLVDDLKTQLVLLRLQEPTPSIRREIAELERRIERAVDYRDCLFDNLPNCDAYRVF